MRLSVKYKIPLSGYLMFCLDEEAIDKLAFNFSIDGFEIEISPLIDKRCSQKQGDAQYPTYGANELIFVATKEIEENESDIDWHLIEDYECIAEKATNRFLRYFQHGLNTPLIRLVDAHDDSWSNSPILINKDEDDKVLSLNIYCDDYSRHLAYGYYPRFGIGALTNFNDEELLSALQNDIQPSLYEEFLCSARTEKGQKRVTGSVTGSCGHAVRSVTGSGLTLHTPRPWFNMRTSLRD
ncbi:hypothetical protein Thimo_2573 [Thioflavicoccus mobilis 8321]|uniref:Uncharacterized protein n=1 Tax=Thioflavicoccus mobilis 8321 TaxID=765912 RepID=L0GZQ5_9GAMM|nr:hypothetical protein [Thioflavicoccus mobilis]AGA91297.1 hypothetical protein Thimo_2573 [Thioflavicoccus mobilis 8321]